MATYTESFTAANGDLGTVVTDLTWTAQTGSPPVIISNQCTTAINPDGTIARAEHSISGTDVYVQFVWAGVDGLGINAQIDLYAGCGTSGEPFDDQLPVYTQIYYDGSSTFVQIQDYWTGTFLSPIEELTTTSPIATWRFEVEGDNARVYRAGVLVCSGTGVNTYRPIGARAAVGVINKAVIDSFEFGDLASSPTGSAVPTRTSDVPFLQANDRYQVVACVDQGTSTTSPEFRYWYANAPDWPNVMS